jgi:hypothetical protein
MCRSSSTLHRGNMNASPAAVSTRTRILVGYLAIAALLPYFALKLAWIAGSTLGIAHTSQAEDAVVQGGNIATAAMEMIAVVIILAFTHSWGRRVPAWLVLPPTWIAAGLLAPFIITGPAVAVSVATESFSVGDGSLEPWVGPLVYISFGAQAMGITASFVVYARCRWPHVLADRLAERPSGDAEPALRVFAWSTSAVLAGVALIRAAWAGGWTTGLGPELIDARGVADRLADASTAVFAVAAIAGFITLVLRYPRNTLTWICVLLVWLGSGAVFGSGLYSLALFFGATAGAGTGSTHLGLTPFLDLTQVLVGAVVAVAGTFVLAQFHHRRCEPSGDRPRSRKGSPAIAASR